MIHPDNEVWFHDHTPDEACNDNCYEQVKTGPIPILHTLYFTRLFGDLHQVYPLTHAHKHNGWYCLVEDSRTGQIVRIHDEDLIRREVTHS